MLFPDYRYFLTFVLFVGFVSMNITPLHAQKKYKTMGKKFVVVTITDPGELYSTYELNDEEAAALKKEFGEDLFKDITGKYNEGAWPSKFGDFDTRIENEETTKKYKVFLVKEFDGKNLLVVPAKYNKGMGEGFAPDSDFYLVIGDKGLNKAQKKK